MRTRTDWLLVVGFGLAGLLLGALLGSGGCDAHEGGGAGATGEGGGATAAAQVWTCSMHPQIRQDRPGECPICGMDLVPAGTPGADGAAGAGALVALSESAQRIASIEVALVERRPLEHELATVGRIALAEPLIANLTARTRARVERVWADFTGTAVAGGDHLVDLYSPALVIAQQELLSAPTPELAALARRKLALWGVSEAELDAIVQAGRPRDVITLHSPIGGIVIEKNVVEGMYVDEGAPLYTIADLSTVWLKAEIYELDLPWVAIGQPAHVEVEGLPGQRFAGTVAFVDPVVNDATRTVGVRVNLPNPGGRLRPGMFARATLHSRLGPDGMRAISPLAGRWVCPMHPDVNSDQPGSCSVCGMDLTQVAPAEGEAGVSSGGAAAEGGGAAAEGGGAPAELLVVPVTAVLDTGSRRIVYIEEQPGHFAAREVALGPRAGAFYPLLSGVDEGERLVVHGAFLLDSQAQIEGRPSLLFPHGLTGAAGSGAAEAGAHAGHGGGH